VGREQRSRPSQPNAGGDEDDQVVADAFEVGDQVRGQHDADALIGNDLHQALQELPPCERVEPGYWLVQDQQLRPLGHRDGQRQLRPLSA
jgi:hypothetical protein